MRRFTLMAVLICILICFVKMQTNETGSSNATSSKLEVKSGEKKDNKTANKTKDEKKKKGDDLKDKMEEAETEARSWRRKYQEECLKKAKEEVRKAEQKLGKYEIKEDRLKIQLKGVLEQIKYASQAEKKKLEEKIKKAKKKLKKYSLKKKKMKITLAKATRGLKGYRLKRQVFYKKKKEEKILELKKIDAKIESKLQVLQKLKRESENPYINKRRAQKKISAMESKLTRLNTLRVDVAATIQKLNAQISSEGIKMDNVIAKRREKKADSKCTKLQDVLDAELKKANDLKLQFNKQCAKALKTKKNELIIKAINTKKQMGEIIQRIEKVKEKIQRSKQNEIPALKNKLEQMEKIMKIKQEKLKLANEKIKRIKEQINIANDKIKRQQLEKKKKKLSGKVENLKKELEIRRKKTKQLEIIVKNKCKGKMKLESAAMKGRVVSLQQKLLWAEDQLEEVRKANAYKDEIREMKLKAALLEAESLKAYENKMKTKADKEIIELVKRMKEITQNQMESKERIKAIQSQIEAKTQSDLIRERDNAKKVEKKLKERMKVYEKEAESLKAALKANNDRIVKNTLEKTKKENTKKIQEVNKQMLEEKKIIKSLDLEINLKRKAEAEGMKLTKLVNLLKKKLNDTDLAMEQKYMEAKVDFNSKTAKKSQEIQSSTKKTQDLKLALVQAKKEAKDIKTQFDMQTDTAKKQVEAIRKKFQEEKNKLETLQKEYKQYKKDQADMLKKELEKQENIKSTAIKGFEGKIKECQDSIANLTKKASSLKIKVQNQKEIISSTGATEKELVKLSNKLRTNIHNLDSYQEKAIRLNDKIWNLCAKIEPGSSLTQSCNGWQNSYKKLNDNIAKTKAEIETLKREIKDNLKQYTKK